VCGRYGYESPEFSETRFQAQLLPDVPPEILVPRYNIAPTQPVLTVAASKRLGGQRGIKSMVWGLTPNWALRDRSKPRSINIKAEGILDRPTYRHLLLHKRCAVLGDGFYEWQHLNGKTGQPYSIGLAGGEPFAFAGIWTATKDEQDEWLVSCAILTTGPNELVAQLHNRQPVILTPDQEQTWLDPDVTDAGELMPMLAPLDAAVMEMFAVPRLVNNVAHEGPALRERVPDALQASLL
jgi:putative SOS response-associated peptidase YedK